MKDRSLKQLFKPETKKLDTAAPLGDEDHHILIAMEVIERGYETVLTLIRDLATKEEDSAEFNKVMRDIEKGADGLGELSATLRVMLERRAHRTKAKRERAN